MPYDTRRNRFLTLAAVAVTALAGFGVSADRAEAAPEPFSWEKCSVLAPPDASGELTPNIGCEGNETGGTRNPDAAQGDYNGLFGQSGWVELAKDESVDNPVNFDYTDPNDGTKTFSFKSNNGNLSGSWSVGQGFRDMYAYLAIVLKDGDADPAPTIAYLIGDDLSGSWTSPWVGSCDNNDYTNDNGSDCNRRTSLSNVQLIGVVPLPASALLLLGGIGGLGALRATRRKA